MERENLQIKIGISGNPSSSGGYLPFIKVGFEESEITKSVIFPDQVRSQCSVEFYQSGTEACFVLVLNPECARSYGASRAGSMCIFLSIPAKKSLVGWTPYSLLCEVLKIFRQDNMIQRTDTVWEYKDINYDRTPFLKLAESIQLEDLPSYVQMKSSAGVASVSAGSEASMQKFFEYFQYREFSEYSKVVVAEKIDGSVLKLDIPCPVKLDIKYRRVKYGSVTQNNPECEFTLVPDKSYYENAKCRVRLNRFNLDCENCSAHIDWDTAEVIIGRVDYLKKTIRVPVKQSGALPEGGVSFFFEKSDGSRLTTKDNEFELVGEDVESAVWDAFRIKFNKSTDEDLCGHNIIFVPGDDGVLKEISVCFEKYAELLIEQKVPLKEKCNVSIKECDKTSPTVLGEWAPDNEGKAFLRTLKGFRDNKDANRIESVRIESPHYKYTVVRKSAYEPFVYTLEKITPAIPESRSGGQSKAEYQDKGKVSRFASNPDNPATVAPQQSYFKIVNSTGETLLTEVRFKGKCIEQDYSLITSEAILLDTQKCKEVKLPIPQDFKLKSKSLHFKGGKFRTIKDKTDKMELELTADNLKRTLWGHYLRQKSWVKIVVPLVIALVCVGVVFGCKVLPTYLNKSTLEKIHFIKGKSSEADLLFIYDNWPEVLKDFEQNKNALSGIKRADLDSTQRQTFDEKQSDMAAIQANIDNQVKRYTLLMKNLRIGKDKTLYKLTFEDPKRIMDWMNEYGSLSEVEDTGFVKRFIPDFVTAGGFFQNFYTDIKNFRIKGKKDGIQLSDIKEEQQLTNYKSILAPINEKCSEKDDLRKFRSCLQAFYLFVENGKELEENTDFIKSCAGVDKTISEKETFQKCKSFRDIYRRWIWCLYRKQNTDKDKREVLRRLEPDEYFN